MENSDGSIYNEIVKTNATSTPVNEKVMCREETDGDLNARITALMRWQSGNKMIFLFINKTFEVIAKVFNNGIASILSQRQMASLRSLRGV